MKQWKTGKDGKKQEKKLSHKRDLHAANHPILEYVKGDNSTQTQQKERHEQPRPFLTGDKCAEKGCGSEGTENAVADGGKPENDVC